MKPKRTTVKLAATLYTRNTAPGQSRRYRVAFADIAGPDADTPAAAAAALAALVDARTRHESTRVRVLVLRGHVGIFSLSLDGSAVSQHVHPGHEGELHSCSIGGTLAEALASFRYHVAQLTWDGHSYSSDILADPEHVREFRSWAGFQLAYQFARASGEDDRAAHRYAIEHPFSEPERHSLQHRDIAWPPLPSLVAPAA